MKKNEVDIVVLINQIQAQITALDKKVDGLINRPLPAQSRPSSAPSSYGSDYRHKERPMHTERPMHKERMMHKAVCADCQKECSIPFRPTGDRPVYCQDCFSKHKMISMSKIGMDKPREERAIFEEPKFKGKKTAAPKKFAGKKKISKKK